MHCSRRSERPAAAVRPARRSIPLLKGQVPDQLYPGKGLPGTSLTNGTKKFYSNHFFF